MRPKAGTFLHLAKNLFRGNKRGKEGARENNFLLVSFPYPTSTGESLFGKHFLQGFVQQETKHSKPFLTPVEPWVLISSQDEALGKRA